MDPEHKARIQNFRDRFFAVYGFQVTHNLGTKSHEAKLLGTVKFHNARNDFITNEVAEPPVSLPEPGVVMASTLTGDSTPATQEEAALYKTRCQELEKQVEAQHQEIADLRAQLNIREQVLIFYTMHNLILI